MNDLSNLYENSSYFVRVGKYEDFTESGIKTREADIYEVVNKVTNVIEFKDFCLANAINMTDAYDERLKQVLYQHAQAIEEDRALPVIATVN